MPRKKNPSRPTPPAASRSAPPTALEKAISDLRHPGAPRQTVSGRWLLSAAALSILAAGLCAWGVLCFLFAQGSWQLLYHPSSSIIRTPASANLDFETIVFAPNASGVPQLAGWWIPAAPDAPYARFTVLYLHGQDGNLSNTIDDLAFLHSVGLNVFAFDYRGYGQSQFQHPTESRWRADAEAALNYLTQTRHLPQGAILLDGKALGANLALDVAAAHPELAGTILDQPLDAPMNAVFNDPRSALVPAHLLVRDRYATNDAASSLQVPSIWFVDPTHVLELKPSAEATHSATSPVAAPQDHTMTASPKTRVWLTARDPAFAAKRTAAITRWLDDLSVNPARP